MYFTNGPRDTVFHVLELDPFGYEAMKIKRNRTRYLQAQLSLTTLQNIYRKKYEVQKLKEKVVVIHSILNLSTFPICLYHIKFTFKLYTSKDIHYL